jgi:hypothetical protein
MRTAAGVVETFFREILLRRLGSATHLALRADLRPRPTIFLRDGTFRLASRSIDRDVVLHAAQTRLRGGGSRSTGSQRDTSL